MILKVDEKTSVVFDLDDTLYKEIDYLQSAYISIAKKIQPLEWEFLYAHMFAEYRAGNNVFETIAMDYKIEKEVLIKLYRNHLPKIKLENGAYGLIKKIKAKKGKLGILTDGRNTTQMNKLHSLGIIDFFDTIGISENLGSEKPNKKNFEFIENELKTESYCYIADNFKKDFITPNKLGWTTIGILDNGLNIHNTANTNLDKKYKPQRLIRSFLEIDVN